MSIRIFLIILLFIARILCAQNTELPGNTDLPSSERELKSLAEYDKENYQYSVEDYFGKPQQSGMQLSPDGRYFSYFEKLSAGKKGIFIQNAVSGERRMLLEEGQELIRNYLWINSDMLIYFQDQGGDENYHLYALDINTGDSKDLTPFSGVRAKLINELESCPNEVIIALNKNNPQVFEPFKVNVTTGEMQNLYINENVSSAIVNYDFDDQGVLRSITRKENGLEMVVYYLVEGEFKEVLRTDWKDMFRIIDFASSTAYEHDVYAVTNLGMNYKEIVLFDMKNGEIIKRVFSVPGYDIGGMGLSKLRNNEIDFYYYTGEKTVLVPVSESFKKLHARMKQEFGDYQFIPAGKTDMEDKYLFHVSSDRVYGRYYYYDAVADKVLMLIDMMPQLKEKDMLEMKPISFLSRDGIELHGYITMPQMSDFDKFPLIVNPHGGPYGQRDYWTFNPESQLFASRGYAVLQVNFRGSGGYGKKYEQSGYKQMGRKLIDDLEDGVAYVCDQGWIDKDRIAIYGSSYGGYAVLSSLMRNSDLYACGVDYCGPSNLFTLLSSIPSYWKPFREMMYEQVYDPENEEESVIMEIVSPALHAEDITKPLFVIQGANDPRVNINESDMIVSSLRERGFDVPYMVKYNEGHGFYREENKIEMYKTMLGFLAKNLKE